MDIQLNKISIKCPHCGDEIELNIRVDGSGEITTSVFECREDYTRELAEKYGIELGIAEEIEYGE